MKLGRNQKKVITLIIKLLTSINFVLCIIGVVVGIVKQDIRLILYVVIEASFWIYCVKKGLDIH